MPWLVRARSRPFVSITPAPLGTARLNVGFFGYPWQRSRLRRMLAVRPSSPSVRAAANSPLLASVGQWLVARYLGSQNILQHEAAVQGRSLWVGPTPAAAIAALGSLLTKQPAQSALRAFVLGLSVRRGLTPPDPGAADAPLGRRSALPNPPGAFSRTRERAAPLDTQGRVVVRHSPCTPWRLRQARVIVPHSPKTPCSRRLPLRARLRTSPAPGKSVPHLFPNPSSLVSRRGREGHPLDALPLRGEQRRPGKQGRPLPPCARLLTRTTVGPGR